jgi:hypothetical protein
MTSDIINRWNQLLRQSGAGIAESVLSSPAAGNPEPGFQLGDIERIVPNGAYGLYALASLGTNALMGKHLLGGEAAGAKFMAGVDQANQMLNVADPKDFTETVYRVALPGLLPIKAALAPTKLGRVANVVANTVTPFNTTPTSVVGTAMSTVVPALASDAISEAVLPEKEYAGLQDAVMGQSEPQPAPIVTETSTSVGQNAARLPNAHMLNLSDDGPTEPVTSPVPNAHLLNLGEASSAAKPGIPNAHMLNFGNTPEQDVALTQAAKPLPNDFILRLAGKDAAAQAVAAPEFSQDFIDNSTVMMGAGAALVAGVAGARVMLKNRLAARQLTGAIKTPHIYGAADKLDATVFDQYKPITEAVRRFDPESAESLRNDIITSQTHTAHNDRVLNATHVGELPNSDIIIPKLSDHYTQLANFTPEQRAALDDMLTAATAAEDLVNKNLDVWGIAGKSAKHYSVDDLGEIIKRNGADPAVMREANRVYDFYSGMREYFKDGHLIDEATYKELGEKHKYYVPLMKNREDDAFIKVMRQVDPHVSEEFDRLRTRDLGEGDGVLPGQVLNPSDSHLAYLDLGIRTVERNRVRMSIVDTFKDTPMERYVSKVSKAGDETITVYRNGTAEHWKITEPTLRSAMQMAPANVVPILNTMRRVMQMGTTGKAAPDFLPVSMMYEAFTAPLTRMKGTSYGLLSEATNRMGLDPKIGEMLSAFDPTQFLGPVTGGLKGIWGELARSAWHSADRALQEGKALPLLGDAATRKLANIAGKAFADSTVHHMQRLGAGNAPAMEHVVKPGVVTDMMEVAPAYAPVHAKNAATKLWGAFRGTRVVRAYELAMNAFHNGARTQFMASNRRPGMTAADWTRLAAQTRELTGDTAQRGLGTIEIGGTRVPAVDWFTSTVPYASVALQVPRQLVRAFKDHKYRFMGTLGGMTVAGASSLMWQFASNPIAADKYWREWTPQQRAERFPLFDGDGNLMHEIAIEPQQRLVWSPFIEMLGSVLGYKDGLEIDNISEVREAFMRALDVDIDDKDMQDLKSGAVAGLKAWIPGVPQIARLGVAAYGGDGRSLEPLGDRFGIHPQRTERVSLDQEGRAANRWTTAWAEGVLTELFGASALRVIDAVDSYARLDNGSSLSADEKLGAAWRAFTVNPKDRLTTVGGPLLWDYEKRIVANDSNVKLVQHALDKIKDINQKFTVSRAGPGKDGEAFYIPPELAGTQLGQVADMANKINSQMQKMYRAPVQELYKELDGLRSNTAAAYDPMGRRRTENEIALEIREYARDALAVLSEHEDHIGRVMGIKNFRFRDLDLAEMQKAPVQ